MNELDLVRAETITELSNEFIVSIKKILLSHGNDPHLAAILAASFTMSINHIDTVTPGFSKFMHRMLEPK